MNLSFASLPYKLIALGAIIAALGAFHYIDKGYAVRQAEKAVETRLNASYRDALEKARLSALATTEKLQDEAKQREQIKDMRLRAISNSLDDALNKLSKRPIRPPDYSTTTTVVQACSGRELYKEDGEFLTREAARAEALIEERDYYYDQYEHAREVLAKQGKDVR